MKNIIKVFLAFMCLFNLSLFAQNLTEGEYFLNTDPGVGNGTPLPSFTASDTVNTSINIPTTGLAVGFHNLFIRYKDVNNQWGIYEGRSFYIQPPNTAPPLAANISEAEYFFNIDPGVGNGTPLPSFTPSDTINSNLNIPTTGLAVGFHNLFIRYKDANNNWGIYEGRSFYIQPPNTAPPLAADISEAEYFFNIDPGVGNGTPLPSFTPSDTINSNLNIPTTGLAAGVHNLFIRYKDANNNWGIYEGRQFEVVNCTQPNANFTVPQNTCQGDTVFFTDNSSNTVAATNYIWDLYNDGNTDATFPGDVYLANQPVGIYDLKLTLDHLGCRDSIVKSFSIVPNYNLNDTVYVCSGTNFTYADGTIENNVVSSTSHINNLQSVYVCDSIVTTYLFVLPSYSSTENITICSGTNYTFPDGTTQSNITSNLTYNSTLTASNSCDSVITTNITINPAYTTTVNIGVCSGASYTFPDGVTHTNITANETYTSTFTATNACDSSIITNISVTANYQFSESVSICSGENYTFPDGSTQTNITANTSYVSTLTGSGSCDTLMTTNLTVNPNYNISETVTICSETQYTFPDGTVLNNILANTSHISTLQSVNSCDSIVTTNLVVTQTPIAAFTPEDSLACSNDTLFLYDNSTNVTASTSYFWDFNNGQVTANTVGDEWIFAFNGPVEVTLTLDNNGCTSSDTHTMYSNLSVGVPFFANICSGEDYTFPDGTVFNDIQTDTAYTSLFTNVAGCDSFITVNLNVNETPDASLTVSYNEICEGDTAYLNLNNAVPVGTTYAWDLNNDGSVESTYNGNILIYDLTSDFDVALTLNNQGCVDTSIAFVDFISSFDRTVLDTVCGGTSYTFPDGSSQILNSSTSQISTLTTSFNCDSVITSEVYVLPTYNLVENISLCSGENYTFPDGTIHNNISVNESYTSSFQTETACDSIITTNISVYDNYSITETVTICSGESYTFPDGSTQNNIQANVNYTSNLSTVNSCDSIVNTSLIVNPSYETTETVVICSGEDYTFPDGNTTTNITSDISYTSILSTSAACDSIIITEIELETENVNISNSGSELSVPNTFATYQWTNCATDTEIEGATSASYSPDVNGSYSVTVTNSNGCEFKADCVEFVKVGIENEFADELIKIYPNPFTTHFIIELEIENVQIEVLDITGKRILSKKLQEKTNRIDLKDYSDGVYFVEITLGNETKTYKVIKK